MKRLNSLKYWAAAMPSRSDSMSTACESPHSRQEQSDGVLDFLLWVRSLPDAQKATIRSYLANGTVADQEKDWNLRFEYVARYVKVPGSDFQKICTALGVHQTQVARQPLSLPADQGSSEHQEPLLSADSSAGSSPVPKAGREGNVFVESSSRRAYPSELRSLEGSLVEDDMDNETLDRTRNPQRIMFPVEPTNRVIDEALGELCKIANLFLEEAGVATVTNPAMASSEADASKSESKSNALAQSRTMVAALRAMRANFELCKLLKEEEASDLAMRIEPALRELMMDESCYKVLPAPARALVRAAASEAYNAGARIFFSSPNATLHALAPLLQRISAGAETEAAKDMCSR
jgi:hypothetical protein